MIFFGQNPQKLINIDHPQKIPQQFLFKVLGLNKKTDPNYNN